MYLKQHNPKPQSKDLKMMITLHLLGQELDVQKSIKNLS